MESNLKVVLDTNVFVSALLFSGSANKFLLDLLSKQVAICLSTYIVAEVEEVIGREKFENRKVFRKLWLRVKDNAEVTKVRKEFSAVVVRDPKDHPVLLTARKSGAGIIETGDDDLLVLKEWKGIRIVTMREMQEEFLKLQGIWEKYL